MEGDAKKRTSQSMVAAHPPANGELVPVETLAEGSGMDVCSLAGLRRANDWAEGKQVTPDEFNEAVIAFENRPMGSGRGESA
jgi:hypothetical protein